MRIIINKIIQILNGAIIFLFVESIVANTALPGPIAVIDVETTGLFPFRNDRIVEIAAVIVDPDYSINREFVSLVNPGRDIGPSRIHGLSAEEVSHAPTFKEVAGHLLDFLNGTMAIAGHNIRFDSQFLESELTNIGLFYPNPYSICTMRLAGGGTLRKSCQDYGIPIDGNHHSALDDAKAAAKLMATLLPECPRILTEIKDHPQKGWPTLMSERKVPITRSQSKLIINSKPHFLQRLIEQDRGLPMGPFSEASIMAYTALLDNVLEDRRIDEGETSSLFEMANRWGLNSNHLILAHREYLRQLAKTALLDGVVTESERRDLKLVARLLGEDPGRMDELLTEAESLMSNAGISTQRPQEAGESMSGKTVCFTGELTCNHHGMPISRDLAQELAKKSGMIPAESVTKKLDILVVADPHSSSGKAKKARDYGIRILHEPVFWKLLGIEVS